VELATHATRRFDHPPETVFEAAVDAQRLPRTFVGAGPIPAVRHAELITPGPLRAGSVRRIQNSDGSVIDEQIVSLEIPSRHQYRLPGGFAFPFNLLVREAESTWLFAPAEGGTRVDWTYRFTLTTPLVAPLVLPIVKLFFARAMTLCLTRLGEEAASVHA
jgi:uncharacterized protein YndB with AHSA1/START domain